MVICSVREGEEWEGTWNEWKTQTTHEFWVYNVLLAIQVIYIVTVNSVFLLVVLQDFKRRGYVLEKLTEMLEIDVFRKSSDGIRLLSLNFIDPASLLTWKEMRSMVTDVGKRFFIRLEGDIISFILCAFIEIALVFAKLHNVINLEPLLT
jgi:hypothetical protein